MEIETRKIIIINYNINISPSRSDKDESETKLPYFDYEYPTSKNSKKKRVIKVYNTRRNRPEDEISINDKEVQEFINQALKESTKIRKIINNAEYLNFGEFINQDPLDPQKVLGITAINPKSTYVRRFYVAVDYEGKNVWKDIPL